jgi:predicted  nucleic acid-binding Zn-ribbon protein
MQSLFAARFTAAKEEPEVDELEERIAAYQDLLMQNEQQQEALHKQVAGLKAEVAQANQRADAAQEECKTL